MNSFFQYALTWIFAISLTVPLSGQIPQKPPLTKYSSLWLNSPFTSKPKAQILATRANPLNDFILTGIAQVPGGYRITIVSKKNQELKKVIEPGGNSEFKVISVNRNPEKTLGTTVTLSDGKISGTVGFEPDQITLKAPPVAPVNNTQPQGQPAQTLNANNTPPNGGRVPRPRIVPAANPPQNQAKKPTNNRLERRGRGNN